MDMHRGKEAIRDWLRKHGHASRYTPKKWNIKVDTDTHTVIIKNMRDAIEFVIGVQRG